MAGFSVKQMSLQDYWHVFLRRKWMIIIPTVIVLGLAIPGVEMITPIYQAKASLIPEEIKASDVLEEVSRVKSPRAEREDTAKEKLLSQSYLLEVAEKTELLKHLPPKIRTRLRHEHDIIGYMRSIVRLNSRGGIIYVTVEHPSPKQAMVLANSTAETYVKNTEANRRSVTGKSYDFLNQQLLKQEETLRKAEEAYQKAMEEKYADTLKGEDTGISGELKQLRQTKIEVELKLADAQRSLKEAEERDIGAVQSSYADPHVTTLEAEISGLQTQLNRLLMSFTDEWPEVVQKREELTRLQSELTEARAYSGVQMTREQRIEYWGHELRTLSGKLQTLEDKIDMREKVLATLPASLMEVNRLKTDMDSATETYTLLKTNRDAAMITQAAELENLGQVAAILDRAIEPRDPIKPKKRKYHMLALALGIMIGTGTAFLAEYFDQSIHSADDIKRHLGVPVLGTIPHIRQGERPNLQALTPHLAGLLVLGLLLGIFAMDMVMAQILSQPSILSRLAGLMFQ